MITIHILAFTFVFMRLHGSIFDRHLWGVVWGRWPTFYLGKFKIITGPRGLRWWLCSPLAIERYVDCPGCKNSGFSGYGTGYDDVCGECGGQSVYGGGVPAVPWWRFW